MAGQPVIGTITGIPNAPTVNVRAGPATTFQIVVQLPKNTAGLRVVDVQPDAAGGSANGKLFQWFRLVMPDGVNQGWVRDDLLSVVGDASRLGYGVITAPTIPFYLVRQTVVVQPVAVQPVQTQPVTVQPVTVQPVQVQPVTVQPVTVQPVTVQPVQAQPVTVQPVTAQPVQAQSVAVQVTVTTQSSQPAANSGPATAICMVKTGGNVRPGAAQTHNPPLGKINYQEKAAVLGFKPDEGNGWLNWIKITYQGKEGWVREDFVRLSGKLSTLGLPDDLYPSPAQNSWWVRDYDPDGTKLNNKHAGWDHAGSIGAPITAGPRGGVVVKDAFCKSCGAEGSSSVDKGFSLMDSRIWGDQNWNFGYGHYIIVRYDHSLLPASTQQWLAANSMAGYHAFVMHAHLSAMLVKAGDNVSAGQQIAKLGNSGNSSGPHLHLELRFGKDSGSQWAQIAKGLASPGRLFYR